MTFYTHGYTLETQSIYLYNFFPHFFILTTSKITSFLNFEFLNSFFGEILPVNKMLIQNTLHKWQEESMEKEKLIYL
jgi:hypothetical protein